jgi:tetratricopeptide (TPR) repeat protein
MLRRLLFPGLLLVSALTTGLFAAQEPPPSPQPFPTATVQQPPLPQPFPTAPVPIASDTPPLTQTEENDPSVPIIPVTLPLNTPADLDGDLHRALGRLHMELEALARERADLERQTPQMGSPGSAEWSLLRQRLFALRKRLEQPLAPVPPLTHPTPGGSVQQSPEKNPKVTEVSLPPPGGRQPGDPYLLAQAQFRAGQYQEALDLYHSLQPESLSMEERLLVQYLSACCLRKMGKLDDAITLYREVADAREDVFLAECSLWHLSNITWRRDVEKQLAGIRAARLDR